MEYIKNEMQKNKNRYILLANAEMAIEAFAYVKKYYPQATMVEWNGCQYIVMTEKGRKYLVSKMNAVKAKKERELKQLDKVVSCLLREEG